MRPLTTPRACTCSSAARGLLAVVAIAGCGRLHFDELSGGGSDAVGDGVAACLAFGPWAEPVALVALNSDRDDLGPSLSTDRRTLYFESDRLRDVTPELDLYVITRSAVDAPWSAPMPLDAINRPGIGDANPELTHDGLTLYFTSNRAGAFHALHRATRASLASEFGSIEAVAELASEIILGPSVSRDETELYYSSPLQDAELRRAVRSPGGAFSSGTVVPELASQDQDGWPSLFADDLAMYFHSTRGDGNTADLYLTTRPAIGAPWSMPQRDTEISLPAPSSELDVEISADGLEMFFASNRQGGAGLFDLYVTTRSCL